MDWRICEGDCIAPVEDLWTEEGTDMSVIAWDDILAHLLVKQSGMVKNNVYLLVDIGTCFTTELIYLKLKA